ncbi:MAG: cation-translocating P-type ATPase [Burkholderiaceae bacterium]|nr:cation-translocating P-type ATPase [Burkholderiaceae bacterium]
MTCIEFAGDPSTTAATEVAIALQADVDHGLTDAEASRRLAQCGRNELRAMARLPAWRRWLSQFNDPLVFLLLGAAAVALAAWVIEGRHGGPVDAIVIVLVVVLNAVLGYLQEAKAASAVAALARMTATTCTVLRDGHPSRIPSAELVPGDVMVLAEGDAVGADARLIQVASLQVMEASLTGESQSVLKDAATLPAPLPLGDRLNMVFKGTAVAQGSARAVVTSTGMRTEVGSIAALMDATRGAPTPLQDEVARIGRRLGMAALIVAGVVIVTILLISDIRSAADVIEVLLLGVSLAVAAVPEGLPAILSVVLAMGVQRMARENAIVKKLASVETLGSASVIATDKTGTLTRAEMTIVRVMTASGGSHVTGVGYAPDGRVEHQGAVLTAGPVHDEARVVLSGGSLAGNAGLRQTGEGEWEIHGDPTEAAFLVAERKLGTTEHRKRRFTRLAEIAFTSDRKMMSTIEADHDQDDAPVLITKGAPDVLLARCTRARVGKATVPLDDALRQRVLDDVDTLSDAALRTLAVAYRPLDPHEAPQADGSAAPSIERDLIYVGTVGIIDPPRTEVAAAIGEAHRAGIRVVMITGDHPRTALRIARDLGIVGVDATALTGTDLDALDDAAWADAVRTTSVFARVAPKHKLRIVAVLQAAGNVVAMTGDGVNDAPALKAADIGIAMGRTGTEVTKEAADMILADDHFDTIVLAVREGRGILDNIKKFLRYLLSSNLGEVLTVFLGVVGAGVLGLTDASGSVVLPLLATQILWINLITDAGPALAMGADPIADDVMARPPRKRTERVIDARMWLGVLQVGLVMAVVSLLAIDSCLPGGLIEGTHDLTLARTAGFTVLVFAQLFNCLNARSENASAFRGLFANHWLWGAIALSTLLQVAVVHIGVLNLAFGTAPLSIEHWLGCAAMASVVLWFSEARKWAHRAGARHSGPARR